MVSWAGPGPVDEDEVLPKSRSYARQTGDVLESDSPGRSTNPDGEFSVTTSYSTTGPLAKTG